MKKKILSIVLLSSVVLGVAVTPITASADDTDSKIAAQDSKINALTAQQASAQSEVDSLQGQITDLQTQKAALEAESEKLAAETAKLNKEIAALSAQIVERSKALEEQARSVQTNSSSTNYVDVLMSADSVSDAITRVQAVTKIVNANKEMVEQQQKDKEDIEVKAKTAQENDAKNFANQQEITNQASTLKTKQADLQVAQLNLAAEKATAESDKQSLLDQKAAAEAAAKAAAQEEANKQAAAQAAAAANEQAVAAAATTTASTTEASAATTAAATTATTNTNTSSSTSASSSTGGSSSSSSSNSSSTSGGSSSTTGGSSSSSSSNTYPVGQCTWGAKVLAPWAGNNWGNGAQWASSAAAAGFRTGSQPQVGAIASWNDGGYGHVAVVTGVQSTTSIKVSEANYAGNQSIGNYRNWFNPTNCQGTVTYIYPS